MISHCENWVISCLDSCPRSYGVFSALARSATRRSSTNCCHSLKFIDVFFARRERTPVYGKCISSRHFDAIGTKTCRIMLYGRFNDILVANRHYLALTDDFSDLDEVLRRFSDAPTRQEIVEELMLTSCRLTPMRTGCGRWLRPWPGGCGTVRGSKNTSIASIGRQLPPATDAETTSSILWFAAV